MGVHKGANQHLPLPAGKWDYEPFSRKFDVSSSIPLDWFISCNDTLFADTRLTLHKSQVHFSGVMQWRACSSLICTALPAETGFQACDRIVLLLVFIA